MRIKVVPRPRRFHVLSCAQLESYGFHFGPPNNNNYATILDEQVYLTMTTLDEFKAFLEVIEGFHGPAAVIANEDNVEPDGAGGDHWFVVVLDPKEL